MNAADALASMRDESDYLDNLADMMPQIQARSFSLWLDAQREHLYTVEHASKQSGKVGAWEAITSMHEDIDRLEAKNIPSLKPGYFVRRRAEVHAIECELHRLQELIDAGELEAARERDKCHEAEQRAGMLTNVLRMAGLPWIGHWMRPITDAAIYARAAERVEELRRGVVRPWMTRTHMLSIIKAAVREAHWSTAIEPTETLAAQHPPHATQREEGQAAA